MIACYYSDISEIECKWSGPDEEIPNHLISAHEVLSYSACKHNKIILELILDLDTSGYRFVVLTFTKNSEKIVCLFEEYFDEKDNIFRVMLRSCKGAGLLYSITLQGKFSHLEYCGNMLEYQGCPIENTSNCLQVHALQLKRFAYVEDSDVRYKLIINLM